MKRLMFVCLVLCANYGFAQQYYPQQYYPQQYPQNPQYVPQVVSPQQTTVVTSTAQASDGWRAVQQPPMVPVPPISSAPPPVVPPTYEGWRDGWRESWVHEFRPLNNRECAVVMPQQNYYPQQTYYPQYSAPAQYYYPQAQQWCTPQQQVLQWSSAGRSCLWPW